MRTFAKAFGAFCLLVSGVVLAGADSTLAGAMEGPITVQPHFTPMSEVTRAIRDLASRFRCSDRYLPAVTLYQFAAPRIPAELNLRLAKISDVEFLEGLKTLKQELFIDRGDAENFIKYQAIQRLICNGHCFIPNEEQQQELNLAQDAVMGLSQEELDHRVGIFDAVIDHKPRFEQEFDFNRYDILQRVLKPMILNNDHYNFKMAAGFHTYGEAYLKETSTYRLYARGTKDRAYMIAAGTDLALELLQNIRFEEREIQFLKQHADFKNVDPAFFDYLRKWRFNADVRIIPPGSVFFGDEPLMEITGDKISGQLVETLIIPIVATMSYMATTTRRDVDAANGKKLVEGGSRRSANGLLGAISAIIGGAAGTSNDEISRLFKVMAFGSMAHAFVGQSKHELDAIARFMQLFPNSSPPIDTYSIPDGLNLAIRAASETIRSFRVDSKLPQKTLHETLVSVRDQSHDVGFGHLAATASDGLTEEMLFELEKNDAPVASYLVGTQIHEVANGGLHMVYKVVERQGPDGEITPVAKTTIGKEGIPGQTQIWRMTLVNDTTPTQRVFVGDVIAELGHEISPSSFTKEVPAGFHMEVRPVLVQGSIAGQRVYPLESLPALARRAFEQVSALPKDVRDLQAKKGAYPVILSPELKTKLDIVKAASKPKPAYRVIIFPGTYDPVHPEHLAVGYRASKIYQANELIYLPTGDNPVHRGKSMLTAEERANSLETEIEKLRAKGINAHVSRVETEGRTRYTVDSVREIEKTLPPNAEIFILSGEDVFLGLPKWENAMPDLFVNYNWIVAARGGRGALPYFEREIPGAEGYERITNSLLRNEKTGKTVERVNFQTGVYRSATEVRERIRNVRAIFHGTDAQETFFEFPADDPRVRQRGALGVPGSDRIIQNITALTALAYRNPEIKSIFTKDSHYEIEMKDPKYNGEFHEDKVRGIPGFPAHGMALRSGPQGHEIIAEVRDIYPPESRLTIPHHQQIYGANPDGSDDRFELVPFDLTAHMHQILDPHYQIVIEKNGPNSYDFAMNPRSEQILRVIGKKPVYIYGVATDFCVVSAAKTYLKLGYEVYLVEDAIAGVFEESTRKALEELRGLGVIFVKTADVLKKFEVTPGCDRALKPADI